MRIVIVNTSERKGGAATAAHRLYKALAKEGHDVFMLVRDKQSNDPQVFSINEKPATRCMNRIRFLWERLLIFITNRFNRKKLFRVSTGHGIDLSEHPLLLSADIIHLHWVNQCFLSLNAIRKLAQRGNVVWTLHDLWPVTAVCHYPGECQKYKKGCSHCELLPPIAGLLHRMQRMDYPKSKGMPMGETDSLHPEYDRPDTLPYERADNGTPSVQSAAGQDTAALCSRQPVGHKERGNILSRSMPAPQRKRKRN